MIAAILTCAGNGSRFGSNKLLEPLRGKPIFIRTIEQFVKSGVVDEITVTVREEYQRKYLDILARYQMKIKTVIGGEKRFLSAYAGLQATTADKIIIHDGARPLTPVDLIREVVHALDGKDAVMTAVCADTCVKLVQGDQVEQHAQRASSYLGQTPHGFSRTVIEAAYKYALEKHLDGMDDAELVAELGYSVYVIHGCKENIKITTPIDLLLAEKIIESDWREYA